MSKDSLKIQVDDLSKKQLQYLIYQIVERKFGNETILLELPKTMVKESQVNYDLIRELLSNWMLKDIENEKDVQYWLEKLSKDGGQITFAGQGSSVRTNLAALYVFGSVTSSLPVEQLKITSEPVPELLESVEQKIAQQEPANDLRQEVDVLIFTAINEEYEEVVRRCKYETMELNSINKASYLRGSYQRLSIALHKTDQGNPRSAAKVASAIAFYKPMLCIFVGIAGGVKKVKLLDVVVPNRIDYIEFGKDSPDGHLHRPLGGETDRDMAFWLGRFRNEVLNSSPQILNRRYTLHEQPIASGEEVATSKEREVMQRITEHVENAVAYEMEGLGFYVALQQTSLNYLIIRCISDYIDKKDEHYYDGDREKAAETAVAFTFDFISFLQSVNFFNKPMKL